MKLRVIIDQNGRLEGNLIDQKIVWTNRDGRWASWMVCSVQLAHSASWMTCLVQLARSASWTIKPYSYFIVSMLRIRLSEDLSNFSRGLIV